MTSVLLVCSSGLIERYAGAIRFNDYGADVRARLAGYGDLMCPKYANNWIYHEWLGLRNIDDVKLLR